METQADQRDDDMPSEIDFSKGSRGKFLKPGAAVSLPAYLDAEVHAPPDPGLQKWYSAFSEGADTLVPASDDGLPNLFLMYW